MDGGQAQPAHGQDAGTEKTGRRRRDGGDDVERTRPLAEEAERELAAPLAKRLDIRSLLERDGETLKLLVKSDGSHQLAATRLPDGRIALDPPGPQPAGKRRRPGISTWEESPTPWRRNS